MLIDHIASGPWGDKGSKFPTEIFNTLFQIVFHKTAKTTKQYLTASSISFVSTCLLFFFRSEMDIPFTKVIFVIIYLWSFTFSSKIFACECPSKKSRSLYNEYQNMSYVFIGTVTNVTTAWRDGGIGASRDVQFHIDQLIKNPSNFSAHSVVIYTPKDRSACGIHMKLNERWQIWAEYTNFFSEDEIPRWLTVINCGRSTKHFKRYSQQLRQWSTQMAGRKQS